MRTKISKKFFSFLLVITLLIGSIYSPVSAADEISESSNAGVNSSGAQVEDEFSAVAEDGITLLEPKLVDPKFSLSESLEAIQELSDRDSYSDSIEWINDFSESLKTPLGMQGFEDDFDASGSPVRVIVQLNTLPVVVLDAILVAEQAAEQTDQGTMSLFSETTESGQENMGSEEIVSESHDEFMSELSSLNPSKGFRSYVASYTIDQEFSSLFNGYAMTVNANLIESLSKLPSVHLIVPDTETYVDPIQSAEASLSEDEYSDFDGLGMADSREVLGISELNDAGFTGSGILVGILDTGVDYNHPDLSTAYDLENFVPDANATTSSSIGYDFVDKDNDPMETTYEDYLKVADTVPYVSTRTGTIYNTAHGSHVAGTIAGRGVNDSVFATLGVAPEASLRSYRVLGPYGSGLMSSIVGALEMAEEDGCDVINMSLGFTVNIQHDPAVVAVNNAVLAGMVVCISAGNSGDDLFTAGLPGVAGLALTVGAGKLGGSDTLTWDGALGTDEINGASLELRLTGFDFRQIINQADGLNNTDLVETEFGYEFVRIPNKGEETDYASLGLEVDTGLNGKFAVVQRAGASFTSMYAAALKYGAAALIVINSSDTFLTGVFYQGETMNGMPTFSVFATSGTALTSFAAANAGKQTYLTLSNLTLEEQPNELTDFSSRGPALVSFGIKPDIIAPGYEIMSTVPAFEVYPDFASDDYEFAYKRMNGTSMACPHIAGIAALMVQKFTEDDAGDIKARLMNTASDDLVEYSSYGTTLKYSVYEIGAGLVDPTKAIYASTKISVDHKIVNGEIIGDPDLGYPGTTYGTLYDQKMGSMSFGLVQFIDGSSTDSDSLVISITNDSDLDKEYYLDRNYHDDSRLSKAMTGVADLVLTDLDGDSISSVQVGAGETVQIKATMHFNSNQNPGYYEGVLSFTNTSDEAEQFSMPFAAYMDNSTAQLMGFTAILRPLLTTGKTPSSVNIEGGVLADETTTMASPYSNMATFQAQWKGPVQHIGILMFDDSDGTLDQYLGIEEGTSFNYEEIIKRCIGITSTMDVGAVQPGGVVNFYNYFTGYVYPFDENGIVDESQYLALNDGVYRAIALTEDLAETNSAFDLGKKVISAKAPDIVIDNYDYTDPNAVIAYPAGAKSFKISGRLTSEGVTQLIANDIYYQLYTSVTNPKGMLLGHETNAMWVFGGSTNGGPQVYSRLYNSDKFKIDSEGYFTLILTPTTKSRTEIDEIKLVGTDLFATDYKVMDSRPTALTFGNTKTPIISLRIVESTTGSVNDGVNFSTLSGDVNNVYMGEIDHVSKTDFSEHEGVSRPILWQYKGLETTGSTALTFLSKFVLDGVAYNSDVPDLTLYTNSTLRKYLDGLYENSFSDSEKQLIQKTDAKTGAFNKDLALTGTADVANRATYGILEDLYGETLLAPIGFSTSTSDHHAYWSADYTNNGTGAVKRLRATMTYAGQIAYLRNTTTPISWWLRNYSPTKNAVTEKFTDAINVGVDGKFVEANTATVSGVLPIFKMYPETVVFASKIVASNPGATDTLANDNYKSSAVANAQNYKLTLLNESIGTISGNFENTQINEKESVLISYIPSITSGSEYSLNYKIVGASAADQNKRIIYASGSKPVSESVEFDFKTETLASGTYKVYLWLQKNNEASSNEAGRVEQFTLEINDTTKPTVLSISPSGLEVTLDATQLVKITFSEAMEPGAIVVGGLGDTITGGKLLINGVETYYESFSWDSTRKVLQLSINPSKIVNNQLMRFELSEFKDKAGNEMLPQAIEFKTVSLDTQPPYITSVSPSGSTILTTVAAYTIMFSETMSVNDTVNLSIDNGASLIRRTVGDYPSWYTGRKEYTVDMAELLPDTEYTVQISGAKDAAGNEMLPTSHKFKTAPVREAGKPYATPNQPSGANANNWFSATVSFRLTPEKCSSGHVITSGSYQVTNSPTFPTDGTWTNLGNLTGSNYITLGATDGTYYVHWMLDDQIEQNSGTFGPFNIDKTKPLANTTELARAVQSSETTVTLSAGLPADATSGIGYYKWQMMIDGVFKDIYIGTESNYTVTGLTAGSNNKFQLVIYDKAGNNIIVGVPYVEISAKANGTDAWGSSYDVSLTPFISSAVTAASIKTAKYMVTNSAAFPSEGVWTVIADMSASTVFTTNLSGDCYIHYVFATDYAIYSSEFNGVFGPLVVDGEAPVINKLTAVPSKTSVNLDVQATDSQSGIAGYQWQIKLGDEFVNIGGATLASYTHTSLQTYTNYTYRVVVTDNAGNVKISDILSSRTLPDITITSVLPGNKQASVSFDIKIASGKGYTVFLSASGAEGSFNAYSNVKFNSKALTITGLEKGKTYYAYIVYTQNSVSERSAVFEVSAK